MDMNEGKYLNITYYIFGFGLYYILTIADYVLAIRRFSHNIYTKWNLQETNMYIQVLYFVHIPIPNV